MMTEWLMHPVLPFVVAAALAPLVGVMGRRLLSIVAPRRTIELGLDPAGLSTDPSVVGLVHFEFCGACGYYPTAARLAGRW
jgi:hypothetical protein